MLPFASATPVRLLPTCTPLTLLTWSCIARRAVIERVGAPTASLCLIALPDDSALGGNAIVPLEKVERCKRGLRLRHANRDVFTGWNRVAFDNSNPLVTFTALLALLTDYLEPTGASSVLVQQDGGKSDLFSSGEKIETNIYIHIISNGEICNEG